MFATFDDFVVHVAMHAESGAGFIWMGRPSGWPKGRTLIVLKRAANSTWSWIWARLWPGGRVFVDMRPTDHNFRKRYNDSEFNRRGSRGRVPITRPAGRRLGHVAHDTVMASTWYRSALGIEQSHDHGGWHCTAGLVLVAGGWRCGVRRNARCVAAGWSAPAAGIVSCVQIARWGVDPGYRSAAWGSGAGRMVPQPSSAVAGSGGRSVPARRDDGPHYRPLCIRRHLLLPA